MFHNYNTHEFQSKYSMNCVLHTSRIIANFAQRNRMCLFRDKNTNNRVSTIPTGSTPK